VSRKLVTVWEVLCDVDGDGPAGDGTVIRRFRSEPEARRVARESTRYGRPAEAHASEVPAQLARRWGVA
jgi:hypothetical protein